MILMLELDLESISRAIGLYKFEFSQKYKQQVSMSLVKWWVQLALTALVQTADINCLPINCCLVLVNPETDVHLCWYNMSLTRKSDYCYCDFICGLMYLRFLPHKRYVVNTREGGRKKTPIVKCIVSTLDFIVKCYRYQIEIEK